MSVITKHNTHKNELADTNTSKFVFLIDLEIESDKKI